MGDHNDSRVPCNAGRPHHSKLQPHKKKLQVKVFHDTCYFSSEDFHAFRIKGVVMKIQTLLPQGI